jgi:hypothetical protein
MVSNIKFASDHHILAVSFFSEVRKKALRYKNGHPYVVLIADGSHGELQPEELKVRRLPRGKTQSSVSTPS